MTPQKPTFQEVRNNELKKEVFFVNLFKTKILCNYKLILQTKTKQCS